MKKSVENLAATLWVIFIGGTIILGFLTGINVIPRDWVKYFGIGSYLLAMVGSLIIAIIEDRKRSKEYEEKEEELNEKIIQAPNQIFYWDKASQKLERYIDGNTLHLKWIFYTSLMSMILGFGLIASTIIIAIFHGGKDSIVWVTSISGVLAEFIGLTFLIFYRSTLKQTSSFINTLERLNNIAFATRLLEDFPDEEKELKNKTRAEMIKLIIKNGLEHTEPKKAREK